MSRQARLLIIPEQVPSPPQQEKSPDDLPPHFYTPQIIIDKLDEIFTQSGISDNEFTNLVCEATRIETPLFIARDTHYQRHQFYYICRSHRFTNCPAFLNIHLTNGSPTIVSSNHVHNHQISYIVPHGLRHSISPQMRSEIIRQSRDNVPASIIRSNIHSTVSPDALYHIRKTILDEKFQNQASSLMDFLKSITLWISEIKTGAEDKLKSVIVVSKGLISFEWAKDIWIIDDTSNPNTLQKHLFSILVVDPNNISQMLCSSLLNNLTEESFEEVFIFLKANCDFYPKVILCDRHPSQISAIKKVFPETHIVFCQKHLGENFKTHGGDTVEKLY
jgi:hypothetical protein